MIGKGEKRAVLIAGPTASGKTHRAIEIARGLDGLIVNTDSMQVYDLLARLTARPTPEEIAAAPHTLFGHVDPSIRYSTGAWLDDVNKVIQNAAKQNQVPIFVGGTGLYFDALINGFAPVPLIPQAKIQEAETLIQGMDADARMALLRDKDPQSADKLGVADPQRVIRALSVLLATGKPLSAYHKDNRPGLLAGYTLEKIVLMPERARLRQRIADRFVAMMEMGAVQEVEALLALNLDPTLPAMKAIGVSEISAMLSGEISHKEASARAIIATQQYAKRQSTWFRNRMNDWQFIDPFA